jgi:uncharacterized protein (DUF983 family)
MLNNILYSVALNKCPKCNKGNVFISNNPYALARFDKMYEACPHCGEKYEKEPGYFFGAMYVSYALMVGWFVITWAIDAFIVKSQTWQYLTFIVVSIVLLMPVTFRTSRLIWLNFFIHFDKDKQSNANELHK